jgi:phosphatidylglycerophosphate synthase
MCRGFCKETQNPRHITTPLLVALGSKMYPKIRNPNVVWLLSLLTGGLYSIYWVGCISKEINFAEEKSVLPISQWTKMLFLCLLIYICAFVSLAINGNPALLMAASFYWLWLVVKVYKTVANYVKSKQETYSDASPISPGKGSMLLFLWCAGMPYLQNNLNKVITYEQQRS